MRHFALLMLVASLPGARALAVDPLQQPASVLPLTQSSAESLYCGEKILGCDYDPNAYEWRLQRAPVRLAQKPEGESYSTEYFYSHSLSEFKPRKIQRDTPESVTLNDSDVEVNESNPAPPADTAVSGYDLPADGVYSSDRGPAGDYAGSACGRVTNSRSCTMPGCSCTMPSCGCP